MATENTSAVPNDPKEHALEDDREITGRMMSGTRFGGNANGESLRIREAGTEAANELRPESQETYPSRPASDQRPSITSQEVEEHGNRPQDQQDDANAQAAIDRAAIKSA